MNRREILSLFSFSSAYFKYRTATFANPAERFAYPSALITEILRLGYGISSHLLQMALQHEQYLER